MHAEQEAKGKSRDYNETGVEVKERISDITLCVDVLYIYLRLMNFLLTSRYIFQD